MCVHRCSASRPRAKGCPAVTEFAIVGFGSWGLCVLERTVSRARRTDKSIRVHVIEPGPLGGGVYAMSQPDYLVLNNPCGQLSLYAAQDDDDDPPYALGLYEWAVRQGYQWSGHECVVTTSGCNSQISQVEIDDADIMF